MAAESLLVSLIPWWVWTLALSLGFITIVLATCITLMAFSDGIFGDGEWKQTVLMACGFNLLILVERWLAFGVILPNMGAAGLLVAPIFCMGPPILLCNKFFDMEWPTAILFCVLTGAVAQGLQQYVVLPSALWMVRGFL